jgi:hypothetical protein
VQNGNHPERAFIRRVRNQVIAHTLEAQRPGCEVLAWVSDMRERHEGADCIQNVRDNAAGGVDALGADVLPDFIKVGTGFRMEVVPDYEPDCGCGALALFSRK